MAVTTSKKKKNPKKQSRRMVEDSQKMVLTEKSPWPVKEAYKTLRTNIIFSLPGTGGKVLAITSAFRGDGKSINAINIAISFAQVGKKTVIVDCDMRLPTVASKLGLKGTPGLSDFLAGQADIQGILYKVPGQEINMIPAGNIPPDPTALLQSRRMESLISGLRKVYDYVIIDLPPVTTVADAAILSKYIDGFLLVVRHGNTEYGAIRDMLGQLQLADAKIVGFIYNDAEAEGNKYYKRYYYKSKSK